MDIPAAGADQQESAQESMVDDRMIGPPRAHPPALEGLPQVAGGRCGLDPGVRMGLHRTSGIHRVANPVAP